MNDCSCLKPELNRTCDDTCKCGCHTPTNPKHTPEPTARPWNCHQPGYSGDLSGYIRDRNNEIIAKVFTHNRNEDASLIVRAVNSHEELLEALKRCQVRLFMHDGNSEEYELAGAAIDKATKAEGRTE